MSSLTSLAIVLILGGIEPPKYVFVNTAPGVRFDAGNPDSFTREVFDEISGAVRAPEDARLRIGLSFVFDYFRYDFERVRSSLRRYLALSEETNVAVLINLDGMNWWENRPDLWNWWDPARPGYNPGNVFNVEWTDWMPERAVKIGWRNWGTQIRVLPMMNIGSPAVITAHQEALRMLLPEVAAWYRGLAEPRKWLFGGVKLGHEASIGVNAFYYPDGNRYAEHNASDDPVHGRDNGKGWHGGLAPIGYAAVKSFGIKSWGELKRDDVAEATRRYLEMLCHEAHRAGLPPELVYTHQGGTYMPWEKNLPFWPAFNDYATPGWSFYGVDPAAADGLADELDRRSGGRWAAAEWWWGAPDVAGWKDHLWRTLNFKDCRFIAIYNWDCGFRLKDDIAGIEALRQLAGEMK